jgi:hypothetical protein
MCVLIFSTTCAWNISLLRSSVNTENICSKYAEVKMNHPNSLNNPKSNNNAKRQCFAYENFN